MRNSAVPDKRPAVPHIEKNMQRQGLQNYFAIIAIVPAVLSIMAYEFLDYMMFLLRPGRTDYDPITGLGMLIPMALMTELFSYFFSRRLVKKFGRLTDAIHQVAKGDYSVCLDEKKNAPLNEVMADFNRMAKELQSVQTLRTDFINDFSHEFKTPIVSINGFARLLLDTPVTPEEQKEYLSIIAEESERLSDLAHQTLLMSRLDSQVSVPDREQFSLDEKLRQDIILMSEEWTKKNIEMIPSLAPVRVVGNVEIMSHIWRNLLSNAIKFTPEGGRIIVTLSEESGKVRLSVSDTGKGMSDEEMAHVFDRFYQADASHATKGLGLGLSIAWRAAQLSGGTLEVESTPGKGSTFIFLMNA